VPVVDSLQDALATSAAMGWQILWPLILGFALSGVIQGLVRKNEAQSLLPDARPRSLVVASGLGAASSSCSYAAVALARSLFRKGADFTSAMAFQIAATNLVLELGIVLALLLGWQFTLGEFIGGPVMIILVALLFRWWMSRRLVQRAREQADKGIAGSMEAHAAMDMSVPTDRPFWRRLGSGPAFTATSHYFVMDWIAVWRDITGGLLIAGALAAWVPDSWWQAIFFEGHPTVQAIWGPLVGPLVAIVSFVCSVGNVPLAGVLWSGGISFGGVISFLFADLIIIPILLIYRKYYGAAVMWRILAAFYLAMVVTGYVVELLFAGLHITPTDHTVSSATDPSISWNYTSWLNIVFLLLAAALVARFVRTGGISMLRGAPEHSH
jgi:uncharacterized membrane protein YraQ (UPF0718 family)